MASTVSETQGSHKGSTGRTWYGRKVAQATPPPRRVNGADFFGDADTHEQPRVRVERPGDVLPPIHRTAPTDPDPVLKNILVIASTALAERWSSTKVDEALAQHVEQLHIRSGRELEAAQTITRRLDRGMDETVRMAAAIATADAIGALDAIDPVAAGSAMARRAVHASDPLAETGLIPVVRESGVLAPPGPSSPVHVPLDGMAPPIPGDGFPAGLGPLPHRHPRPPVSFPAVMVGEGDEAEALHGGVVDAGGLKAGVWLLDESGLWVLIDAVVPSNSGKTVTIKLANDMTLPTVLVGRQMRVLSASDAKALLAESAVAQDAQVAS